MIITCPNCDASYEVDPETFPAKGRQVRCARCREVWHAVGVDEEEDEDETSAEPPATGTSLVPMAPSGVATETPFGRARLAPDEPPGHDGSPEEGAVTAGSAHSAFRRHRAARAGSRESLRRGFQGFVLGMAAALAVAAVARREDVVRVLPASANLYEAVGLTVNLRGLDFEGVTLERIFKDGLPVLVVGGEVVNLRGTTTPIPALRFALRGVHGEELYSWTVQPRQRELEPGGRMSFRSRLAAPPSGADDIEVRFAERDRRSARSGP